MNPYLQLLLISLGAGIFGGIFTVLALGIFHPEIFDEEESDMNNSGEGK